MNSFLKYIFNFGEKKNFLDLFEEIKIKNNNLLPQFTVGKHGIKKITAIKYQINNHKVFLKNCLLIGLGLEEIGFSDNLSGCVSPIYRVYKIKNNDYLDVLKYTIKRQLWYQKRFISKKSIRRKYEINHQEIKKIFISVMNNKKIIPFSQNLFLINQKTEIIQQQKEKIIQIKKYLLNKMFVND